MPLAPASKLTEKSLVMVRPFHWSSTARIVPLTVSPGFPFLTYRAVNADKRYPLPRLLPPVSESKNSVNTLLLVAKIVISLQTSK